MNSVVIYAVIILTALGFILALILYLVAQRFQVEENPLVDEVEDALPSANCGGCGYAGCRAFAEACVKADDLEALYCPVGGNELMRQIAEILGATVSDKKPQLAVVRCSGDCESRPKINSYDGYASCAVMASLYSGDTGCSWGCLGHGDCVDVCNFDAIEMNPLTGLPVVDEVNCTACNACVVACPKDIIELRNFGPRGRRIFVSCVNEERGGVARRACKVACIGCGKCKQVCPFDAITIENFLAYIDYEKCKLCRKCVEVCPTDAILEINFPPKKVREEVKEKQKVVES